LKTEQANTSERKGKEKVRKESKSPTELNKKRNETKWSEVLQIPCFVNECGFFFAFGFLVVLVDGCLLFGFACGTSLFVWFVCVCRGLFAASDTRH